MIISLIAAAGINNEIGRDNDLPWHMPNDMKFFKETTQGHHMLMGRNTWDSFGGRPLKNRVNIVVTRQKDFEAEGAVVVGDIQEGIELARKAGEEELFILGGGEIFKQTMDIANRIYLTRIYHTFDATVHFPAIDENEWKIVHEDKRHSDEQHKYNYTFFTYERR